MGSDAREASAKRTGPSSTRLADSSSIYLRGAASHAIQWYPWGEEAFREAKRSHRLVLLDIGAAWCHWCHVMDEGTYSDPEIVRVVNESFVPVKVDRDQSPELDRRYQRDVGVLTGSGGWPLTAFLTADGETILGGTYFPPRDVNGHPGLLKILREISRVWREDPGSLRENVTAIRNALKRLEERSAQHQPRDARGAAEDIAQSLGQVFDGANGGFGNAPKFPHPTAISLLLLQAFRGHDSVAAEMALLTLRKMADGGVYDQLGGGFHRYSVDEGWHVPHFEKMTLDNAHLLRTYVEGFAYSGDARMAEVTRGIVSYVLDTLDVSHGAGYAASVDADNAPGDDGSYYTWSKSQLRSFLTPEELKIVTWRFGLDTDGTMPLEPEQNVLYQFLPVREIAETVKVDEGTVGERLLSARSRMMDARNARPAPLADPSIYASINGYLIGSLSLAGRLIGAEKAVKGARLAADHMLKNAYAHGRGVAHLAGPGTVEGWGMLEDQASAALGLLDLSEVTQEGRYLEAARDILETTWKEFMVTETGLLRDVAPSLYQGALIGPQENPTYPLEDNPHLSANAATALALTKLSDLTEDRSHEEKARALVQAMLRRVHGSGLFACGAALAALTLEVPVARVVVEGSGPEAAALYEAAVSTYHPRKVVLRGKPKAPFGLPEEVVRSFSAGTRKARALLCRGTSCLPPLDTAVELRSALSQAP